MPRVSVILTVYNKPQWLNECIDSVLNQTYDDWELIILEDNSPKPEVKIILESYKLNDKIQIYYSDIQEEERYKTARYATLINHGVRTMSSGEFITYLTDDDFYYPDRLEKMVKMLDISGVPIVYGNQQTVDENGNLCGIRETKGILDSAWNVVDHNSVMHRRELFDEAGGWPDSPDIWGGADAHFWERLTNLGHKFYPINGKPLDAKRYHTESVQWLVHNGKFFP